MAMTHTPPLHTVYVCTGYLFTQGRGVGGRELTREKARGAMLHKAAGRKYQHDRQYLQSVNSIKLQ
jgi:hypothetical protein